MTHAEAVDFLAAAGVPGGSWADVGAGTGTFTHALADLIGVQGTVFAIDRDEQALAELQHTVGGPENPAASIVVARGDMRRLSAIPELQDVELDGVLFANVLHFTPEPGAVLAGAAHMLRPGGRLVVIEYDRRSPTPWVPHPLTFDALAQVVRRAGLGHAEAVARRPSLYHGEMYCAVIRR